MPKLAKNQQVNPALLWLFKVCASVRTVQEYGADKVCENSALAKVLMHSAFNPEIENPALKVHCFPKR